MTGDPLALLGGYGSDDGGATSTSSSDDDSGSSGSSMDSARRRAAEAEARLRDFGDDGAATTGPSAAATAAAAGGQGRGRAAAGPAAAAAAGPPLLPSALDAFGQVDGTPAFLNPEATRPLATNAAHGLLAPPLSAAGAAAPAGPKSGRRLREGDEGFDVARLAPRLKGQQPEGDDKRGPPGAVVEGRAKRYKVVEDEAGGVAAGGGAQHYTAAQIAMMGGNVEHLAGTGASKPSRAVPREDFVAQAGGGNLPRKGQDRRDKEKEKRLKGQSTHAHWKSELEMQMRQQYD